VRSNNNPCQIPSALADLSSVEYNTRTS
jgi:hypothetical protein